MNKEEFIRRSGEIVAAAREAGDNVILLIGSGEAVAANLKGSLLDQVVMLIGACERNHEFELLLSAFCKAWNDENIRACIKDICIGAEERPVPSTKK